MNRDVTAGLVGTGVDPGVARAAICRAVLVGRSAVVLAAAGAGLFVVDNRWRVVAVLAITVVTTVGEVSALTRWPAVVRHPWVAIVLDLASALAILALSRGGMAYFCFVAGSAALAGALLGMRALPLWAAQVALGFVAAAAVLRANGASSDFTAFVAAFPIMSLLAGVGGAAGTAALVRYVDLSVGVIAAAQRSAVASERARLARELHDSVAKTLRGVSFAALALPSSMRRHPALAERLAATVSAGAEAADREARELLEGLRMDRPDVAFDISLHLICRDWAEATGVVVKVSADRIEPPVALRYELARILREALTNVQRHAHAREVQVEFTGSADSVELSVWDDGIGFVPQDPGVLQSGGHFGIMGMGERAQAVRGTLRVASAPREGTQIVVRAPLTADGSLTPVGSAGSGGLGRRT